MIRDRVRMNVKNLRLFGDDVLEDDGIERHGSGGRQRCSQRRSQGHRQGQRQGLGMPSTTRLGNRVGGGHSHRSTSSSRSSSSSRAARGEREEGQHGVVDSGKAIHRATDEVVEAEWLAIFRNAAKLKQVNLASKKLRGVPPDLWRLQAVERLVLTNNSILVLPDTLPPRLKVLHVGKNALTCLPPSVLCSSTLSTVQAFQNGIAELDFSAPSSGSVGSTPTQSQLKVLNLNSNRLTALPSKIGFLQNLTTLSLDNNDLHSLPSEIGSLGKLEHLSLRGNALTELPTSISRLRNVKTISCIDNLFTTVPLAALTSPSLETLDLSLNKIASIPKLAISQSRRIRCVVHVASNPFCKPGRGVASSVLTGSVPSLRECVYRTMHASMVEASPPHLHASEDDEAQGEGMASQHADQEGTVGRGLSEEEIRLMLEKGSSRHAAPSCGTSSPAALESTLGLILNPTPCAVCSRKMVTEKLDVVSFETPATHLVVDATLTAIPVLVPVCSLACYKAEKLFAKGSPS